MSEHMQVRYRKPHKWRATRDAQKCIECGVDFVKGDSVFDDVAINFHERCLAAYRKSYKELFGKEP